MINHSFNQSVWVPNLIEVCPSQKQSILEPTKNTLKIKMPKLPTKQPLITHSSVLFTQCCEMNIDRTLFRIKLEVF